MNNFWSQFKQSNMLNRLIYINLAVFVVVKLVDIVMMLAGMWMGMQKLEFFIPGGTIIWRRGSRSGRIASADIVTLDAVQFGENARSFAVIAGVREGKINDLFHSLNEEEAKALLGWIVRQIGEKP